MGEFSSQSQLSNIFKQESRRAYGTAVSKVVIHLNEIQLNSSEIKAFNRNIVAPIFFIGSSQTFVQWFL